MSNEKFDEDAYIQQVIDDADNIGIFPGVEDDIRKAAHKIDDLPFTDRGKERLLAMVLAAAMKMGDRDLTDFCVQHIPEKVEWHILAYNAACYYAVEKKRKEVLKYARVAISLGKKAKQFLDDSDFNPYSNDPEFLEAIGKITKEEMQQLISGGVPDLALETVLKGLTEKKSKISNAAATLEKAYANDRSSFDAVLNGDDPRYRLILAAWVVGREENPTAEQTDRVLNEAAILFSGMMDGEDDTGANNRKVKGLGHYTRIPGIEHFLSVLKTQSTDRKTGAKKDLSGYTESAAVAVAFAGDKIPSLYRIYSHMFFRLDLESARKRRESLMDAFSRCTDAGASIAAFKDSHPWIGREYDLIETAEDFDVGSLKFSDEDSKIENLKKLDAELLKDIDLAVDTVLELIPVPDSTGSKERYLIAWRLWENGIRKDLVDILLPLIRERIYDDLKPSDEPGKKHREYPDVARVVAWMFGDLNVPVEDLAQIYVNKHVYSSQEASYFAKLSKFPARMIQFGLATSHGSILYFFDGVLNGKFINEYLLENGVSNKDLIKYYLSLTCDVYGGWQDIISDVEADIGLWPELTTNQRRMLVIRYYNHSGAKADYDLLIHAILNEDDPQGISGLLSDISYSDIQKVLPSHPKGDAVRSRLSELTENISPEISNDSRRLLLNIYGAEAKDRFVESSLKDGLTTGLKLTAIFRDLICRSSGTKNAKATIDGLYDENAGVFDFMLDHPRPGYRLLSAAYIYGKTKNNRYLNTAVRAAAEVHALSCPDDYTGDTETMGRFREVEGVPELISELTVHMPSEQKVYDQNVLWRAFLLSDVTLTPVYRLASIGLSGNAEEKLDEGDNGRGSMIARAQAVIGKPLGGDDADDQDDGSDDEGSSKEEDFIKLFPSLWPEYILAAEAYDDENNFKKYPLKNLINKNPQAALNLLKAWPGGYESFHKHAYFARQVWNAGIGKEEFGRYVKAHESVMRKTISDKNTPKDVDRFLDWLYGRTNADIADIHLNERTNFAPGIDYTDPFIDLADFPPRLYRFLIRNGYDYTYNEGFGNNSKDLIPFLRKNGMSDEEAFKYELLNAGTPKDGLKVIKRNEELFRTIYVTLDSRTRYKTVLEYFTATKEPKDLHFLFDQYLKDDGAWENDMAEYYLGHLEHDVLPAAFESYADKDKLAGKLRTRSKTSDYTEGPIKKLGL